MNASFLSWIAHCIWYSIVVSAPSLASIFCSPKKAGLSKFYSDDLLLMKIFLIIPWKINLCKKREIWVAHIFKKSVEKIFQIDCEQMSMSLDSYHTNASSHIPPWPLLPHTVWILTQTFEFWVRKQNYLNTFCSCETVWLALWIH